MATIVIGHNSQSRFRYVAYIKENPEIYQEANDATLALGILVKNNAKLLDITIEQSETEVTIHLSEAQIKNFAYRNKLAEALRADSELQRLWAEESSARDMCKNSGALNKSYQDKYEKELNDIWFKISKRQAEIEKGLQL
jgi:hypothetical protein